MEKEVKVSQLLDIYGRFLKKSHRDALDYHYNQDLSLSEMSDVLGITRQGVWYLVKHAEKSLFDLELKLGLFEKYAYLKNNLEKIKSASEGIIDLDSSTNGRKVNDEALKIKRISEILINSI